MHSTLNKWLEELEEETIVLTSNDINIEATGNMVMFNFDCDLLKVWGKGSVAEFICACADLYSRKTNGYSMFFYSWFDEQASQFRISAVSQCYGEPPFGCKLNNVSLCELVNGIYAKDSGLYTREALDIWRMDI
jgi:hypothetical protein